MLRALQHGVMSALWIQALLVNTVLIALAQRTAVLTRSGWVHAAALGTILWGCLGWSGWLAVVAYLCMGSLVTKIGFQNKQSRGLAEARGGQRGPENVWGSAAVGAFLALLIGAGVEPRELMLVGFAASFAAKLADTFGSEIGKRFGRTTVLITSLRVVPPGTEGAISLEGTLASAAGSIAMTLVMLALQLVPSWPVAGGGGVGGLGGAPRGSPPGAPGGGGGGWVGNELVNALQTLLAAVLAMLLMVL